MRSKYLANLAEQRLNLRKDSNVLRVAVTEKVEVDGAAVDKRCGHIPVGDDHAQIPIMLAEQRRLEIGKGLLIELAEIPIARFAHGFFAAQFVQFEDEPCFFLFRHEGQLLFILCNTPGASQSNTTPDSRYQHSQVR